MTELKIGEVVASQLAEEHQAPLMVYDQNRVEQQMDLYIHNFKSSRFETKVLYASKALSCKHIYKLASQHQLGVDVVSLGELVTAIHAGTNPDDIYFHGNNKSLAEIELGVKTKVHAFVADNIGEIDDLELMAERLNTKAKIMLRINTNVTAHTHEYIVTAHVDSKFGLPYNSEATFDLIHRIKSSPNLDFIGFHCHIGSQIFQMDGYYASITKMLELAKKVDKGLEINLGGGFGIKYTGEDQPMEIEDACTELISFCEKELQRLDLKIKRLLIEPGRSIVGEAGVTLYKIGNEKETLNKHYLFVDGGMTDNIRPSLYQAKYACDLANKLNEPKTNTYTIAGKCCESGDILIDPCYLPKAEKNDLLVVYSSGAYGYSMASNYNKLPFLEVVFVKGKDVNVAIKRQSVEAMLEREV